MSKIERFLGVANMVCAFDGKELEWPYYKLSGWMQYPLFSWRQIKQRFIGDNDVLRFCSRECYVQWVKGQRVEVPAR